MSTPTSEPLVEKDERRFEKMDSARSQSILGRYIDRSAGSTSMVNAQINHAIIGIHPGVEDTNQSRGVNLGD